MTIRWDSESGDNNESGCSTPSAASRLRQRVAACFDECAQPAWRLAYSYLRDASEAADVVQQAFVVAATKPHVVPDPPTWPWFSVVVLNEARNMRRKKRPQTGVDGEVMAASQRASEPEPIDVSAAREEHERLWRALDELPEVERDAVVLTHLCEVSHQEAARALDVPRQTVTARVGRALKRLQARLDGGDPAAVGSLAVLPIVPPPGGWESAVEAWRGVTMQAVEVAVTAPAAGVAVGGIAMAKKSALVLSTTVALGLGLAGGVFLTHPDGAGWGRSNSEQQQLAENAAAPSTVTEADEELAALREQQRGWSEEKSRFEVEKKRLAKRVHELESALSAEKSADPSDDTTAGPVFTFGDAGQLAGVLNADWGELAAADLEVTSAIAEIYSNLAEGLKTPKETYLRLQENVEALRKYEYRTIGKIPTAARNNGEVTHPISMTNLIAAQLKQLGAPLSETQIAQINELGLRFEADFAQQRARAGDGTLRVTKLLDEYLIKGEFVDDLQGLLSATQRELIIDPDTHRIASLDLHCPSLMIIHSSPLVPGKSRSEIESKAKQYLTSQYSLTTDDAPAVSSLVEAWFEHCRNIVQDSVAPYDVKHYSYDDSIVAGEATVTLFAGLLDLVPADSEAREKILSADGFLIPRLVEPDGKS